MYVSTDELRKKCGITKKELVESNDVEKFLCYLEYVINMVQYFYVILANSAYGPQAIQSIIKNIDLVLDRINYEYKNSGDGKWIIVEKNSNATAVAEIINNTKVIEYNHYLFRGDIKGKSNILKLLANDYEKVEPSLKQNGYKDLANDMGFLFNNLGIRHSDDKLIKDMSQKDLEEWYDKTYDMFLHCILANNHIDIKKDIKELKTRDKTKPTDV